MLIIHVTEAVKFMRVFVCCAIRLDEPDGELDDGALREVVAVAEGVSAWCHDFSPG